MGERPLVQPSSSRVNLDEVFDNVCENAIREPIHPYKLVICELVRTFCGVDPEETMYTHSETMMLNSLIYGLTQHEPMPFPNVLRCIRHFDQTFPRKAGIYHYFMKRIEKIDVNGAVLKFDFPAVGDDKKPESTMKHLAYRSPVSIWAMKVCICGNSLTHTEQFKLHEQLLVYIRSGMDGLKKLCLRQDVPFEIETSSKTRDWIDRQLHLLQVCPSVAVPEEKLLNFCGTIKKRHKDVAHVHLLEMVHHIRNRNPYKAQECLRQFFDYSVFRPNSGDMMVAISQVKRIGMTDQRAFRYGPLLAARIHRNFGDKQMARSLLRECIREAHSNLDKTCMILVMVELAALEGSPLTRAARIQARKDRVPNDGEPPITCHDVSRLIEKESTGDKQVDFRDFGDDDAQTFQNQLSGANHYCKAIIAAKSGSYLSIPELLRDALHNTSTDDLHAKSRLLSEAANALLTGLRLQQGFMDSARSTATAMVECNNSDGIAPHHETEAHAIAHINIIYSHAMQGRWDQAVELIEKLDERFPQAMHWQCAQHVLLAKSLIHFDNAFRLGKWKKCEAQLKQIEAFSHEEHLLRECLFLAQRGRVLSAIEKLSAEISFAEKESSFIVQARMKMQLEMIQQQIRKTDPDSSPLNMIKLQAMNLGLDLLAAMATRRIGVLYLLNERYDDCQLTFTTCEKTLHNVGTPLELALLYIGWSRAKIQARQDPIDVLAKARKYSMIAGFPLLEKLVMKWVAEWFNDKIHNPAKRDDATEQFCALDDVYPGYLDWELI